MDIHLLAWTQDYIFKTTLFVREPVWNNWIFHPCQWSVFKQKQKANIWMPEQVNSPESWKCVNRIFSTFCSYLALYHTKLSLVKIFNSTNSCWMWHKVLLMGSMKIWDQIKKIVFFSNIFTKLSLINIKNQ